MWNFSPAHTLLQQKTRHNSWSAQLTSSAIKHYLKFTKLMSYWSLCMLCMGCMHTEDGHVSLGYDNPWWSSPFRTSKCKYDHYESSLSISGYTMKGSCSSCRAAFAELTQHILRRLLWLSNLWFHNSISEGLLRTKIIGLIKLPNIYTCAHTL